MSGNCGRKCLGRRRNSDKADVTGGVNHPLRSAYPPANHYQTRSVGFAHEPHPNFRRPFGKLGCRNQHCELSGFRGFQINLSTAYRVPHPRITNKPVAWNLSTKMIKKSRLKTQTPGFQTTFHIFSTMPGRLRRTCGLFVAVVHKQILRREPAYPIFRIFIDYPRIVFFIAVQFAA